MINSILIYLFEAGAGVALLALIYRTLFSKLTFFQWNRIFMLTGIVLCILLPLCPAPEFLRTSVAVESVVIPKFDFRNGYSFFENTIYSSPGEGNTEWVLSSELICLALISIYFLGFAIKAFRLLKGLVSIENMKRSSTVFEEHDHYRIYVQQRLPTFSFGKNIFLNSQITELNPEDLKQVIHHELAHIQGRHTLDLILMEVAAIMLWFNPGVHYLAKAIREVHEYLVDQRVTSGPYSKVRYGQLLVKLAGRQNGYALAHQFSDSQILKRLKMLTKPKSNTMQKLKFLVLIPLLGLIVLLSSCFDGSQTKPDDFVATSASGSVFSANQMRIGKIIWEGNKLYPDTRLQDALGLATGDVYDSLKVESGIFESVKGKSIASMYMDNGYLFFRIDANKNVHAGQVDLTFKIVEGQKARIRKLIVKGNKKVSTAEILGLLEVKPGELFDRSRIIASQASLAKSGKFDPQNIVIYPIPDHSSFSKSKDGFVDFEFQVTEL